MQKNGSFTWEIAVPNGDYAVHVVSGDAGYIDSVYKINVENVLTVDGTPTSSQRWIEGTKTVTVTDGKLTISNADGGSNNRICFVDISAYDDGTFVGLSSSVPSIFEDGSDSGQFTLTRSGSVTNPLTVNYTIGGSATGGDDYDAVNGIATFAAGSDTATIDIVSHVDSAAEGDETVMLTLSAGANYFVSDTAGSATVTIIDDDAQATPAGATSSFFQRINFQPDGVDVPDYYKADIGSPFGLHKNGLTYGWSADNTAMGTGALHIPHFAAVLREIGFTGPSELQSEYAGIGGAERGADQIDRPRQWVIGMLKRDVLTIRKSFEMAGVGLEI